MRSLAAAAPSTAPLTLLHAFRTAVAAHGPALAAKSFEGDAWTERSWSSLDADVRVLAAGLRAWGIEKGQRIAIMAATSLPWVVVELAIFSVGAVVVPIYPTSGIGDVEHVLNDAGACLAFVADAEQLARIGEAWQRAPSLARVIVMNDDLGPTAHEDVHALAALRDEGERALRTGGSSEDDASFACGTEDLAFLVYTSGTTGRPKGAMITHGNHMACSYGVYRLGLLTPRDTQIFFLPLAHCFAQMLLGVWFLAGAPNVFARRIETVVDDMGATHPTCFAGVPRLFEKVYNKVVTDGSAAPGLKGFLFRKTIAAVELSATARARGKSFFSFWLLVGKLLVLPKIRERLVARMGGRMTWMVSGGAPLAAPIMGLFDACGLNLYEGYGLTECMGPATVNTGADRRIGSVGRAIEGMTVRLADDGEVLIKGPAVMRGYWNQPEATRNAIDDDGWLHSGDIGEIGPDGRLAITDRKKDLIVTANGKKVAPQNAENALKTCPLVSQVVVYGDRRPYLTALVTVNEDTSRAHLRQRGVDDARMTFPEVSKHPAVRALIQESFDRHNVHVGRFEMIRRFVILDHDFTLEAGDLTATLKVRRDRIVNRYADRFQAMYEEVSLLRRSFTIIQALTQAPGRKRSSDG
jgi:long-chain acyl-CoA synthetase